MKTLSVDRFGRVLIPKDVRDRLGLYPESELTLRVEDHLLVLQPVPRRPQTSRRQGVLVVEAQATDDLREATERFRGERLAALLAR